MENDLPGWKNWANDHIKFGKPFYLLPQTIKDLTSKYSKLPTGFIPLLMDDMSERPPKKLTSIYKEIVQELGICESDALKWQNDIELIGYAGLYAAAAIHEQISFTEFFTDGVVLASGNAEFIEAVLETKEKRSIVDKILHDGGMEHLITVRLITNQEEWVDFE